MTMEPRQNRIQLNQQQGNKYAGPVPSPTYSSSRIPSYGSSPRNKQQYQPSSQVARQAPYWQRQQKDDEDHADEDEQVILHSHSFTSNERKREIRQQSSYPPASGSGGVIANNSRGTNSTSSKGGIASYPDQDREGIQTKSCLPFRHLNGTSSTETGKAALGVSSHQTVPATTKNVHPKKNRFGWKMTPGKPLQRSTVTTRASSTSPNNTPEDDEFRLLQDEDDDENDHENNLLNTNFIQNYYPVASSQSLERGPLSHSEPSPNQKTPPPGSSIKSANGKTSISSVTMTKKQLQQQQLKQQQQQNKEQRYHGSSQKNLFIPPPVQDRGSDRKRIKEYQQEKLRRGVYDGEMEPEGVRGQEAKVAGAINRKRFSMKINPRKSNSSSPPSIDAVVPNVSSTTSGNRVSVPFTSTTNSRLHIISPVSQAEIQEQRPRYNNSSNLSVASSSIMAPSDEFSGNDQEEQQYTDLPEQQQEIARTISAPLHAIVTPPSFRRQQQQHRPPPYPSKAGPDKTSETRQAHIAEQRNNSDNNANSNITIKYSDISESSCSDDNLQHMVAREFLQLITSPSHSSSKDLQNANNSQIQDQHSSRIDIADMDGETQRMVSSFQRNNTTGTKLQQPAISNVVTVEKSSSIIDKQPSTGTSTTTESTPDPEGNTTVDELNAAAMQCVNTGRYDDALQLFTRVLQIHQAIHGLNTPHPSTASSFHNIGTVYAKQAQALEGKLSREINESKDFKEHLEEKIRHVRANALHSFQAAARSARDSLGKNHPNVAVSLVRIGFLLLQARQYGNAETTFAEALRIRLEHYGPEHALVANLYNNLGVCRMHLGKFSSGHEALEEALKIQRKIIVRTRSLQQQQGGDSIDDNDYSNLLTLQMLELADTLFNIGGLCIEWIRRERDYSDNDAEGFNDNDDDSNLGNKGKAVNACQAFEEAVEIRLAAYDYNTQHAAVLQVQHLFDIAKQYAQHTPHRGSLVLPQKNIAGSNKTSPPFRVVTPTHGNSNGEDDHSPRSMGVNIRGKTSTTRSLSLHKKNDYSKITAAVIGTSAIKATEHEDEVQNDLQRPPVRRVAPNGAQIRNNTSIPKNSAILQPPPQANKAEHNNNRESLIFRQIPTFVQKQSSNGVRSPPVLEVTISNDGLGDDDDPIHQITTSSNYHETIQNTRIYVAPHEIPKVTPRPHLSRRIPGGGHDTSDETACNTQSLDQDNFTPDISIVEDGDPIARRNRRGNSNSMASNSVDESIGDNNLQYHQPVHHSGSYDAEENCLISGTGVDSDHGRIHYPITWNKAGLIPTSLDKEETLARESGVVNDGYSHYNKNASYERNIIVAQPFRSNNNQAIKVDYHGVLRTNSSNQWGSETVNFSTGNRDRDDIMERARRILEMHNLQNSDDDDNSETDNNSNTDDYNSQNDDNKGGGSNQRYYEVNNRYDLVQRSDVTSLEQDLLEDGVAPLSDTGASNWNDKRQRMINRHKTLKEMTDDPMANLPEIHQEASRQLQNNNAADAIYLFEIILGCQRRKHGSLHPDVAAALHNVGIAQLRSHNHIEALKAFEEAARVRKGSLGKDHPLVAVSLVKVGITLLLLHRFDEALWTFREALSVRKNSLGPLHPSTARIYNNIGCVYVEFNEFREARRAFEAALDTQRNALVQDPQNGPLMFGTATTLCNLGYLYRFRDMHDKAAIVLKEALELQEHVLGPTHATVLSTLDNLADSCATCGNGNEALSYYNMVLDRFRANKGTSSTTANSSKGKKISRAEAVLLYKMSRVHRMRNDRESQLKSLQSALRSIRYYSETGNLHEDAIHGAIASDSLERRILSDIRVCREQLGKEELKWI